MNLSEFNGDDGQELEHLQCEERLSECDLHTFGGGGLACSQPPASAYEVVIKETKVGFVLRCTAGKLETTVTY